MEIRYAKFCKLLQRTFILDTIKMNKTINITAIFIIQKAECSCCKIRIENMIVR